jgi:collagenase-like PrtC family protease
MAMTAGLSLGPVFFNWPADSLRDFYLRIADEAPVDTVHLGEVVCWKRAPFFQPHLAEVIDRLTAAGKEVVLSSLALISTDQEMAAMRDLAAMPGFLIEANDIGVADLLAGRPHAIGPFVNVYNEDTLAFLAACGAVRCCLPAELPRASVAALAGAAQVDIEVQVFGRLPLSISARCFHARSRHLHKDGCQFVCAEDADGLPVRSLDDEPFVVVNGTQTLSDACCCLVAELDDLQRIGVSRFRLSPQATDMVAVARIFRDVLAGRRDADAAAADVARLVPEMPLANGFFHAAEGRAFVAAETGV